MSHRTPPQGGLGPALAAERFSALATPATKLLLAASVAMAALSMAANLSVVQDLTADAEDTLRLAMHASTVATMIFALVAGVYSATTDRRFGIVDQRALTQPSRSALLAAKVQVAAGIGLLYAVLGAATACLAGTGYYAVQGEQFDLGSAVVMRALLGLAIAAPLFAVLGVCVGTLARNQPIALGGSLVWFLVVEPAVLVGASDFGRWLPGASALALTLSPDEALLSQRQGGLLLTAFVVIALASATHRFGSADL